MKPSAPKSIQIAREPKRLERIGVAQRDTPPLETRNVIVYHEVRWHLIAYALAAVVLAVGTVIVWLS